MNARLGQLVVPLGGEDIGTATIAATVLKIVIERASRLIEQVNVSDITFLLRVSIAGVERKDKRGSLTGIST
jgi:hypothetical protein